MDTTSVPERALPIIGNLLHAIKLITSKVLPIVPISGNIKYDDSLEEFNKKAT